MYKYVLSWRYLRTRYIALASIISVTLGVATLIVVNSVMAGFTQEMHKRLHGILSDVVFESHSLSGLSDPQWHMDEIRKVAGEDIAGMTATVHVPAMVNFRPAGMEEWITRQINLIGIDEQSYAQVSDFSQYLLHESNRKRLSFALREDGYDARVPESGWAYRRMRMAYERALQQHLEQLERIKNAGQRNTAGGPATAPPADIYGASAAATENLFDPTKEQHTGVVMGIAITSVRHRNAQGEVQDVYLCRPGDDVKITFPNAGTPPEAASDTFTLIDFYESKMSEYDSSFAFVPLAHLQKLRGMGTNVTSIQIKLKEGADLNAVRDRIQRRFPPEEYPTLRVQTWRDLQGPLLAAVRLETTILNILLFLIIAVAGFGILATFFMIVVEKTRDIGILKALGAPSSGVMSIFLGYGLSLGAVGSGVGMVLGLLFVRYINEVATGLEWITGREVFDPTVYYFQEIPTIVEPLTVAWVVLGAVLIAVLASILPARHAARLHPVEALRYE